MEMKYYKIKAEFKYAEEGRFYRTFLVREDIKLGELGEFMVDIFGGTMSHDFMYFIDDKALIPLSMMAEWDELDSAPHEPFKYKTLKDVPNSFLFCYDTKDGWDFEIKVEREMISKEVEGKRNAPYGFVLDGKGMGIWEDNIRSLFAYFHDEIDKDYDKEDKMRGIIRPKNFKIKKYSEFDNPLDLKILNRKAMSFVPKFKDEID